SFGVPLGEAVPKIAFQGGGGLVAILGGLREQLHDDRRDRSRDVCYPFARRNRLSRDVTVHPLNRFGGGEWQHPRQHLVERHPERVEVTAAVDRTVHASRLFGSHIGQRARDRLGRLRRLSLARKSRGNPEAGQPRLTSCGVDQDVRGLDVFVDDPSSVYLTKCPSKTSGEPQKEAQLQSRFRGWMPTERVADRKLGEESRQ